MNLEDQWKIRDLLAGALAIAYGRHGTTARDMNVMIDVQGEDVVLRRKTIGIEVQRGKSTEGLRIWQKIGTTDENKIFNATGKFADLHMALLEREKHIGDQWLEKERIPAWTLSMDSLLAHVLALSGFNENNGVGKLMISKSSGIIVDESGAMLKAPETQSTTIAGRIFRTTVTHGWINGGLIGYPFKIRSGSEGAITYDGGRIPKLTIMDQTLPNVMLETLRGRRLDTIVSHPLLSGSPAVISSAKNVGEDTASSVAKVEITLKRNRVPLACPPADIDTRWMTTIAQFTR